MEVEDAPLVYGLELASRCLCSQVGESQLTRFIVGSQSLKQENQIHLLEYDDENNRLYKYVYDHPDGSIWHISANYEDATIFTTCHDSYVNGKLNTACTIWRLPTPLDGEERDSTSSLNCFETETHAISDNGFGGLTPLFRLLDDDDIITHALWKPIDGDSSLMTFGGKTMKMYDSTTGEAINTYSLNQPKRPTDHLLAGKWNPHHGAKQFAVCMGGNVLGWDIRSDKLAFQLDAAHDPVTRELDFNPNKQYYMLTCGDDCRIKFWDVRSLKDPLSVIEEDEHSHWIWSARYNPYHDQLILSCSSDNRVVLYDKSSISSEPYKNLVDEYDDERDDEEEEQVIKSDHLISVFEEHEESVYAVEWSSVEPWSFASLSYDGRVVVNKVPKKVKFDILL